MTGLACWLLLALGLGVLIVRRPQVAIALVSVQALVLAAWALEQATRNSHTVVAGALAARAVALGTLFLLVARRSRERQPVPARFGPAIRAALAVVLILVLTALVPGLGFTSAAAQRTVLALIALGLTCAATRRATVFHVLAIIMMENGLALAALASPHPSSLIIELGVTFDLVLIATIGAMFHLRIFTELGAGDSAVLRSLRD